MKIIYQFEKPGHEVKDDIGEYTLYLDIGNNLKKGIIDHHQLRDIERGVSTSSLFEVKYVEDLIKCDKPIVIYTHTKPDCDALLSTYMAKMVIEEGEDVFNKIFGEDKNGKRLVRYVDGIDCGLGKINIPYSKENSKDVSFYIAVSYLDRIAHALLYFEKNNSLAGFDYTEDEKNARNEEQAAYDQKTIEIGHKLIGEIIDLMEETPGKNIDEYPISLSKVINNEIVATYIEEAYRKDHDIYLEERKTSVCFEDIHIFNIDGEVYEKPLRAAIWKELPKSEFSYLYARAEDRCVVTSIPYSIKGKNSDQSRVIISIDPENPISSALTLKPLAEALELMEQIEENVYYKQTGNWKRDHSSSRNGFEESPFSATSDPWFIHPDKLLVQTPRNGSCIDYNSIVALIENHTKLIKSVQIKQYKDGKPIDKNINEDNKKVTKYTISEWIEYVKNSINSAKNENIYTVITTEVDSVMIRTRNDILRALNMSILGNNVFESKEMLELDYFSSIYADENFTNMIVATSKDASKNVDFKDRRLYSLLKDNDDDCIKMLSERLSKIVLKILLQRSNLYEIGNKMEMCVGNAAKSREVYRKYVEFLALEQKDSIIADLTEQEIYEYVRKMLKLVDVKESIKDTVDIVTTDSKERVLSIFNYITAITVPFIIISTFFQMGMIKLEAFISTEDGFKWDVSWQWLIVLAIVVSLSTYVLKKGKK